MSYQEIQNKVEITGDTNKYLSSYFIDDYSGYKDEFSVLFMLRLNNFM